MTEEEKDIIKTDHFKTMDELIKTCNMWIKDDDYDAYYRFFEFRCMKELINTIQKRQAEIEKKDKIIDLIENDLYELAISINEEYRVEEYLLDKRKLKQYFEKQVESKDK